MYISRACVGSMRHVRNKFLPVVTSSLSLWKLFASNLITSSDESVGGKWSRFLREMHYDWRYTLSPIGLKCFCVLRQCLHAMRRVVLRVGIVHPSSGRFKLLLLGLGIVLADWGWLARRVPADSSAVTVGNRSISWLRLIVLPGPKIVKPSSVTRAH
jgi:hypothetical protein